jgi:Flp pilus assembly protein TadD
MTRSQVPKAASVVLAALLLCACGAGAPTRPSQDSAPSAANTRTSLAAESARSVPYVLEQAPASAVADNEAAVAAMRLGEWTEAELRLEQLMLEHPSLPGPYVNAAILYMRDGRDDDARAALQQALAIDPNHAAANNQLGILLRRGGDFTAAEDAYRRAIEADSSYPLALYNLGVLLDLYLLRPNEALAFYEQYQRALAEPDETVARWIIDLRRRVGTDSDGAARVAQGELR